MGQMRSVDHQDHPWVRQTHWPNSGSSGPARRHPELASVLPGKVSAPQWGKAATAHNEKQLSVESRTGREGKERKRRKMLPTVIPCPLPAPPA